MPECYCKRSAAGCFLKKQTHHFGAVLAEGQAEIGKQRDCPSTHCAQKATDRNMDWTLPRRKDRPPPIPAMKIQRVAAFTERALPRRRTDQTPWIGQVGLDTASNAKYSLHDLVEVVCGENAETTFGFRTPAASNCGGLLFFWLISRSSKENFEDHPERL